MQKRARESLVLCAVFGVALLAALLPAAPAEALTVSQTFGPGPQSFTVPAGVTHITIDAYGGRGGGSAFEGFGGLAGRVQTPPISVSPGEEIDMMVALSGGFGHTEQVAGGVAQGGLGGFPNGGRGGDTTSAGPNVPGAGGGGGASTVTTNGIILVVAGGGGGRSGTAGGSQNGGNGGDSAASGDSAGGAQDAQGGTGATRFAGGLGGRGVPSADSGASGQYLTAGTGGGGGSGTSNGGGGGGAGFFAGGGGGGSDSGAGGGGGAGSSFGPDGSIITTGAPDGPNDGRVTISYTTAPDTTITATTIHRHKATISFTSNDASATFECKLDRHPFTSCTDPATYRRLRRGRHTVAVEAIDGDGTDPSPATTHFRIR
jgi:hypothetical protein